MTASRRGTLGLNGEPSNDDTGAVGGPPPRRDSAGSGASCAADEPHVADRVPHVYCELDFTTRSNCRWPLILSAQCTDVRVNQVTPALFAAYRRPRLRRGRPYRTRGDDRSTGFYRNKATRSSASVRRSSAGSAARCPTTSPIWLPCRVRPQDRQRRPRQRLRRPRHHRRHPFPDGWCGAGSGQRRPTQSRSNGSSASSSNARNGPTCPIG